jgi:hypothetical protein
MSYQQVTLATLQTLLAARWEGTPFWDSTDATNAINEALREWNMLTGFWKERVTLTTVANQVWYSVPSTLVYQLRMDFGSYPMEITSLFDLDNGQPGWEGEVSGGADLPNRPMLFAPAGFNLFAIWPADSVGGTTLVIDSVARTPSLANAGDFVDIGQEELDALLGYALHVAAFKEGGQRFGATQSLYRNFVLAAARRNSQLNASVFFRNAMGYDDQRAERPTEVNVVPTPPTQGQEAQGG